MTFIKKERGEISILLSALTGALIFLYILSQISVVTSFLSQVLQMAGLKEVYYLQLLKMLGVTYVAEFSSAICKDAGQQMIAGMIELFAKISIVILSIPGLMFLVDTLEQFL